MLVKNILPLLVFQFHIVSLFNFQISFFTQPCLGVGNQNSSIFLWNYLYTNKKYYETDNFHFINVDYFTAIGSRLVSI